MEDWIRGIETALIGWGAEWPRLLQEELREGCSSEFYMWSVKPKRRFKDPTRVLMKRMTMFYV